MNAVDLYYNFPQAAYLLFFVLLFLALFWFFYQYRHHKLSLYAEESRLSELLIPQTGINYWMKTAGYCLAWVFLCLAVMQPKGNARYPENPSAQKPSHSVNTLHMQPHEVIFLIDASASMSVLDGRLSQSRLDNAKDVADQVMANLQGQSGSLYAFTSSVSKLSPPSMDYLFMRMMLSNLAINEGAVSGTDLKASLKYIQDNYLIPSTPSIKTLVIISDGEDNHLEELKGSDREKYIQDVVDLLGNPEKEKLHVFTIGVGTEKGGEIPKLTYEGKSVTSHLNEDILKALSEKGNGRYYSGQEYAAVDIAKDLYSHIAKEDVFAPTSLTTSSASKENLIYDLYYQFPLGLAIILLALTVLWPTTTKLLPQRAQRTRRVHEKQAL